MRRGFCHSLEFDEDIQEWFDGVISTGEILRLRIHLDGSTLLTYSRINRKAARTRSSSRLSFRFRIHSNIRPRMTKSTRRCFMIDHTRNPSQEGKLRSFLDRHSLPVMICSRRAATSADRFVMARSTFLCHRLLFLDGSATSSSSSSSSSSICRCDRSSASSCSLMGLRIFIGPSDPLAGGCMRRKELRRVLGDESDELGELLLIWFQTNSSSPTSSLASLDRLCQLMLVLSYRRMGGGGVSHGVLA